MSTLKAFSPLFVSMLIVPAALIAWLWLRRSKAKVDWLLRLSIAGMYVLFTVLAHPWANLSLHLRWILLAALIAASIVSFRHAQEAPLYRRNGVWWWLSFAGRALLITLLGIGLFEVFQARTYSGEALAVTSPLRGGRYVIGHGGSSEILNYHVMERPQTYALDIGGLNAAGSRAGGLLPKERERYAIYGDTVYSPVAGTVFAAVDGLPDLTPPEMDPKNLPGNHIWIRTGDVYIALAHLKPGSVRVRPGQTVSAGEPVGQVGNTGNTSEPHLHMHAVRRKGEVSPESLLKEGDPVPLLVDGRFLVRNSTF